jgi:GcrA cell cycle regulator
MTMPNLKNSIWTPENEALLHRYHNKGKSSGKIAALMGLGRMQVAGKIYRMKLSRNSPPTDRLPRSNQHKSSRAKMSLRAGGLLPAPKEPIERFVRKPADAPCSLMELTSRSCRWPYGDPKSKDFHFCGGTIAADNQPYCRDHMVMSVI